MNICIYIYTYTYTNTHGKTLAHVYRYRHRYRVSLRMLALRAGLGDLDHALCWARLRPGPAQHPQAKKGWGLGLRV